MARVSATPPLRDVVIVGGGVAGGLAGALLSRAGCRTLLLEKVTQAHHKVCGEFISGEGLRYLTAAGVKLAELNVPEIRELRFAARRGEWRRELPLPGYGLSRKIMDETLLQRAATYGCTIQRGERVHRIHPRDKSGYFMVESGKSTYCARHVILATGKHDLRRVQTRRSAGNDDLVGMKMHLKLNSEQAQRMQSTIELYLFPGGYAGLTAIENGRFNFCFVLKKSILKRYGTRWNELADGLIGQNPKLGERLYASENVFTNMVSIAPIPYGFYAGPLDGVMPVGDQLAVIPSLTGAGMNIAMLSASCAVETILMQQHCDQAESNPSNDYFNRMHELLRSRMRWAMFLHFLFLRAGGSHALLWGGKIWPGIANQMFQQTRCPRPEDVFATISPPRLR